MAVAPALDLAAVKAGQQATWASGDYAQIAKLVVPIAERLADSADLQAGSTVRLVMFRLEGQPERRGVAGGCPDARSVLKALNLVDQRPPAAPEGEETVM